MRELGGGALRKLRVDPGRDRDFAVGRLLDEDGESDARGALAAQPSAHNGAADADEPSEVALAQVVIGQEACQGVHADAVCYHSVALSSGSPLPTGAGESGRLFPTVGKPGKRTTPRDRAIAVIVSAHVHAYMAKHTVSQNHVEERAGFKRGRLSRFMTGERVEVGPAFLMDLARAIGSSLDKIIETPSTPEFRAALREARHQSGEMPPLATPSTASLSTVQVERQPKRGGGRA